MCPDINQEVVNIDNKDRSIKCIFVQNRLIIMNPFIRYTLIILGAALAIFSVWYFKNIVAYVLISAVLALIGRPLVELLGRLKVKNIGIPKGLRALVVLITIWTLLVTFFRVFIPLIGSELNTLSNIDTQKVLVSLEEPIRWIESIIDKYQVDGEEEFTVEKFVTTKMMSVFNVSFMTGLFSSFAGMMGNIFIAAFSISFITFFFLKDEHMFAEAILLIVPDKHVEGFKHAMNSTRKLLIRYFLGILGQITGIFTLVTLGLTIAGVGFSHSLLIGLIAGLINVIPYLGPIIGSSLGILIGIATHLDLAFRTELLPLIGLMVLVFTIVQLTDNFLFQPLIYSNSVNAHPLEIFIVIMLAGSLAGIPGMILAIPTYTVIRVFAKEFFNQFKVVKKLTQKIE